MASRTQPPIPVRSSAGGVKSRCTQWQQTGLAPPTAVVGATAAYLEAEDVFAAWIDEYCICDRQDWEKTTTLYAAWKVWAERNGEFAGTVRRFAQTLEQRGQAYGVAYERNRQRGRGFCGLSATPVRGRRDACDTSVPYRRIARARGVDNQGKRHKRHSLVLRPFPPWLKQPLPRAERRRPQTPGRRSTSYVATARRRPRTPAIKCRAGPRPLDPPPTFAGDPGQRLRAATPEPEGGDAPLRRAECRRRQTPKPAPPTSSPASRVKAKPEGRLADTALRSRRS